MREILFRGKRLDNGEWIYGSLVTYNLLQKQRYLIIKFDVKLVNLKIEAEQTSEFVIPETVGQFTGLTDKNGTKIFEGDILAEGYNGNDVVTYDFGEFIPASYFREDYMEVIGNIHEGGSE